MTKFAVTLSNRQILTVKGGTAVTARQRVEREIADRGSKLTVTEVRLITGREYR